MKVEDFCRVYCDGLALNNVPIGHVLRTPFTMPEGDHVAVYFRRLENGLFRVEDDGQTIFFLEAGGFDLDTETRFAAFNELLEDHGAYYDEDDFIIHTRPIKEELLPQIALSFSVLMVRIRDLLLLAANRVRSTFRDDLLDLVQRQFKGVAIVDPDAELQASMRDYQVDIIVRSPDNRNLAIYAGNSEMRALEAMLFWREYREQRISNTRTMLVLETAKPRALKERTLARVMNSGLILASMDGEEISIGNKMREQLAA